MELTKLLSVNSEKRILFALLLVSGAILFSTISPGQDWGGDFAGYLHQGKALANGSLSQFNELSDYRIANSAHDLTLGPAVYPWGFPAVIAAIFTVFGESILAIKILIVGLVLGCQLLIFLLLRGRTSEHLVHVIAFVFAINTFILSFKDKVLSDIPFTFLVLLTLVLCRKYLASGARPSVMQLTGIGVAMSMAFLVRTHALALVPTVAAIQLLGKIGQNDRWDVTTAIALVKRVQAKDFIPYAIFVGAIAAAISALPDPVQAYSESGHAQTGGLERMFNYAKSAIVYYGLLPNDLIRAPAAIYVFIIVPLLICGFVGNSIKNADIAIYVLFHMAILLLYPGRQGLRFILPILPMIFFFTLLAAREFFMWITARKFEAVTVRAVDFAFVAITALGLSGPAVIQATHQYRNPDADRIIGGPYAETSQMAFEFVRENIAAQASVVFWKPRVLSYMTDRKSAYAYNIQDLIDGHFDYVLECRKTHEKYDEGNERIRKTRSTNPEYFHLVYENADFALYKITR